MVRFPAMLNVSYLADIVGDVVPHAGDNEQKNPGNVIGGLKATTKNPNVSEEAKKSAEERLQQMQ